MSKIPNFWQFFNLTSQPTIPSLYWDAYSYEERIKKICDKIWAIIRYLKYVMEVINEFDDRLTVLEELYNALEARVTALEEIVEDLQNQIDALDVRVTKNEEDIANILIRLTAIEELINDLDLDEIMQRLETCEQNIAQLGTDLADLASTVDGMQDDIADLQSAVSTLQTDMQTAKTNIAKLQLNDRFGLKLADPDTSSDLIKTIHAFHPIIFTTNQTATYDSTNDEWTLTTDPFVIQESPFVIGTFDDIVGPNTTLAAFNPSATAKDGVVFNNPDTGNNVQTVQIGTHYYKLIAMFITAGDSQNSVDGSAIGFFVDTTASSSDDYVTMTKKGSGNWSLHIDTFIESVDATTAQSASAADPNAIYYVVETPV